MELSCKLSLGLNLLKKSSFLDQSSVYISYDTSHCDEAEVLGTSLQKSGLNVLLQSSSQLAPADAKYDFQRCSVVIMFLTKS